MADLKKLLEQRKKAKKHQPHFVVKESHNKRKIERRWRFPDGRHSGVRQEHKGKPALVTVGYGTNRLVRGLHSSGLRPVVVSNENQLLSLKKTEGAILSSTLGTRKKLVLLGLAEQKNLPILNVKNLTQLKQKITDDFAARKKQKVEKVKQRSKKEEEKKKVAEKKKKEEEKKKEESKKESEGTPLEETLQENKDLQDQEKKEIEKTIIKKQ